MNTEPVVKKKKSPKFLLWRSQSYDQKNNIPVKFYCISLDGDTSQDNYKKIQEVTASSVVFGDYYNKLTLNKNKVWSYSSINHAMTRKELLAHGFDLDCYIDQEIPENSAAYAYLTGVRIY